MAFSAALGGAAVLGKAAKAKSSLSPELAVVSIAAFTASAASCLLVWRKSQPVGSGGLGLRSLRSLAEDFSGDLLKILTPPPPAPGGEVGRELDGRNVLTVLAATLAAFFVAGKPLGSAGGPFTALAAAQAG